MTAIQLPVNDDGFDAYLASQDIAVTNLAEALGVGIETARGIMYLRTRSRWTSQAETRLIKQDKMGVPVPLTSVLKNTF